MPTHMVCVGTSLKMISTATCGLFAGGALYINLVENPAMLTHDAASAVTMWKPSFVRAKWWLSKMALTSGLSSIGAYACLRDSSHHAVNWLVTGCTILAVIPFTIVFIKPVNDKLLDTEKCIVKGDDFIVEHISYWNKVHAVRTLLGVGAFGCMIWFLGKKK